MPSSPVEELTGLAGMLEKGLLTREEFDLMKAKLLEPSLLICSNHGYPALSTINSLTACGANNW